ncbi:Hachiman antiphage defense system protein HamA, partial [Acinetobacter baumannii]
EIALHAICREYFGTIPVAPRVFYKSSSNDPVKSFDLVHARFPSPETFQIWLGEAKFYADGPQAIAAAIASIKSHIERGFLTREKLLL